MTNITAITAAQHRTLFIDPLQAQEHGRNLHIVPVVITEFLKLVTEYPILLTKNEQTGQFTCSALLGFSKEENLFWKQQEWNSLYLPLQVARQPFFLGKAEEDSEQFLVCVDLDSPCVQQQQNEEKSLVQLFDADDQPSEFLQHIQQRLAHMMQGEQATTTFIDQLLAYELITALRLEIELEGQPKQTIQGLYTIDEKRLSALTNEQLSHLHQQNYLQAIYTMMASLGQVYALVKKKNQRLEQGKEWFK